MTNQVAGQRVNRHSETWLELTELGSTHPSYRPTYDFSGWLSAYHRSIARAPLDGELIRMKDRRWRGEVVQGWLRPADALKLYELAFFARGDVIELGTAHGLSTLIIARALKDAKDGRRVLSVDISPDSFPIAVRHVQRSGLAEHIELVHDWSEKVIESCKEKGRRFAFAFVDHAHTYDAVLDACQSLPSVLLPGAFILFHDYNDRFNGDPSKEEYQVYQAVNDGLQGAEFYGVYGCAGLFRLTEPGSRCDDSVR